MAPGLLRGCRLMRAVRALVLVSLFPLLCACVAHAEPGEEAEPSDPPAPANERDGARHRVLRTARGAVHVFRPRGYDARTAGVLLYVHGYYTDVDTAWRRHALGAQFAASQRNALFIAPEAPVGGSEAVRWPDLDELLLEVAERTGLPLPRGVKIAVAHSGGFRTVQAWLPSGLDTVVLLDALYGGEPELREWLEDEGGDERRLFIVAYDTARRSERFIGAFDDARVLEAVPAPGRALVARTERLVLMRSQYDHMKMVTARKVIPSVLGMTRLERVLQ